MDRSIEDFGVEDMVAVGAALRGLGEGAGSMEELAQRVTRFLFTNLKARDAQSALVLARFFKTHAYAGLPSELKASAAAMLAPAEPWDSLRCLTLLGTAGERSEWNDRRESKGHQAIPLRSEEFVNGAPMVSALARQLGVDVGDLVRPTEDLFVENQRRSFNVFHVEHAEGSPIVPAQKEFVVPCGVRSVVGFGGLLPTGEIFAVVLFSRARIKAETTALFKPLTLSLRLAVLGVAGRVFA